MTLLKRLYFLDWKVWKRIENYEKQLKLFGKVSID